MPAAYLLLRGGNEVLLLQRANTGYQDGKYTTVAGRLDDNELATACIVREAKEEAGITINPREVKLVHTVHRLTRNNPGQERLDLLFEADRWQREVMNAELEKCGQPGSVTRRAYVYNAAAR